MHAKYQCSFIANVSEVKKELVTRAKDMHKQIDNVLLNSQQSPELRIKIGQRLKFCIFSSPEIRLSPYSVHSPYTLPICSLYPLHILLMFVCKKNFPPYSFHEIILKSKIVNYLLDLSFRYLKTKTTKFAERQPYLKCNILCI